MLFFPTKLLRPAFSVAKTRVPLTGRACTPACSRTVPRSHQSPPLLVPPSRPAGGLGQCAGTVSQAPNAYATFCAHQAPGACGLRHPERLEALERTSQSAAQAQSPRSTALPPPQAGAKQLNAHAHQACGACANQTICSACAFPRPRLTSKLFWGSERMRKRGVKGKERSPGRMRT